MSDTDIPSATPELAPDASVDARVDAVMSILGTADGANPAAQTDAATDDPSKPDAASEADGQEPVTDPDKAAEPTPKKYRVKVRGEEVEVDEPELLNGYSRTEDYKAKTAELAEQRKTLELTRQQFADQNARLAEAILLTDPVVKAGAETDWAKLLAENPTEHYQRRTEYDNRVALLRQAIDQRTAEQERQMQEQSAAQKQQFEGWVKQENDALLKAWPELSDESQRGKIRSELHGFLTERGFTADEINNSADHRMWLLARDAQRWRDAEKARVTAEQKRVTAPPTKVIQPSGKDERPGSDQRIAALKQRALRTSKIDDQVEAALAIIRAT